MEDDQQFCLRWNNHQSTLIAVFDTLLENGTLVDCTLAAEGKYLNAHKVVLSACSPYFESLLSQNYDKHPIFILKDVKFQELKAMMDYMYRGEVNISQDQLSALLRAAESLQIKGLSDNRGKGAGSSAASDAGDHPVPPKKQAAMQSKQQQQLPNKGQGLTITEPRRNKTEQQQQQQQQQLQQQQQRELDDREGSVSPGPSRRRKRARRKSTDTDDHLNHHDGASNSSESHQSGSTSAMMTATTTMTSASNKAGTDVPAPIDTKADILAQAAAAQARTNEQPASSSSTVVPNLILKEKQEPAGTSATSASSSAASSNIISHAEVMLEPKSEYIDDMNEDSIEDLTLDDDDLSNMEGQMEDGAGPSQGHGHGGESSQGFGWHMNQGQDEVFMAAQEAVGAHRDSQVAAEDLRVNPPAVLTDTPWPSWPAHLAVPMMLMQESLKKTMLFQSMQEAANKSAGTSSSGTSSPVPIGSQQESSPRHRCSVCGRVYKLKSSLRNHQKWECGKEPQFKCPYCVYKAKQKMHMARHMERMHKLIDYSSASVKVELKEEEHQLLTQRDQDRDDDNRSAEEGTYSTEGEYRRDASEGGSNLNKSF